MTRLFFILIFTVPRAFAARPDQPVGERLVALCDRAMTSSDGMALNSPREIPVYKAGVFPKLGPRPIALLHVSDADRGRTIYYVPGTPEEFAFTQRLGAEQTLTDAEIKTATLTEDEWNRGAREGNVAGFLKIRFSREPVFVRPYQGDNHLLHGDVIRRDGLSYLVLGGRGMLDLDGEPAWVYQVVPFEGRFKEGAQIDGAAVMIVVSRKDPFEQPPVATHFIGRASFDADEVSLTPDGGLHLRGRLSRVKAREPDPSELLQAKIFGFRAI